MERPHASGYGKTYRSTCNLCGMSSHHVDLCHFFIKVHQALSYLRMDPSVPLKNQALFKGQNSYQRNNVKVWCLQDTGSTLFGGANTDNFIGVIDDDLNVFMREVT